MNCRVVNLSKRPYDVYIGRPSKWGNPFSHKEGTIAKYKVNTRKEAIEAYGRWIHHQNDLLNDLDELKGKVLGCFCKPKSCHGDILADLVNNSDKLDLL